MSKLGKEAKRAGRKVEKAIKSPFSRVAEEFKDSPIGKQLRNLKDSVLPDIPDPVVPPAVPLPDEEEIRRARRRKSRMRRTGRASTVLSQDTLG